MLERALGIEEQHFGKSNPALASTLTKLANLHVDLKLTVSAKELLERALDIQEKHHGSDSAEVLFVSFAGNHYCSS